MLLSPGTLNFMGFYLGCLISAQKSIFKEIRRVTTISMNFCVLKKRLWVFRVFFKLEQRKRSCEICWSILFNAFPIVSSPNPMKLWLIWLIMVRKWYENLKREKRSRFRGLKGICVCLWAVYRQAHVCPCLASCSCTFFWKLLAGQADG